MELKPCMAYSRIADMDREQVIARLRAHEQELRASGIGSLVGSRAASKARVPTVRCPIEQSHGVALYRPPA